MMIFIAYILLILVVAKAANAISSRWPEKEGHFGVLTFEALLPGFNRKSEANEYIKEKGWKKDEAVVVKLKEFLI